MKERSAIPTLAKIAAAWQEVDEAELAETFPDLVGLSCGWDEPFCFRCGWLVPPSFGWADAGGWLERAHLHDHRHGGSSEPLNLVPMCPMCHELQAPCETKEQGIAFVNETSDYAAILWAVQVFTDTHLTEKRLGRDALHKLMRAYAQVGGMVAAAVPSVLRGEDDRR